MGALKQLYIGIPHYCRRCDEMLADGQMVCPFCDNDATPVDELTLGAVERENRILEALFPRDSGAPNKSPGTNK